MSSLLESCAALALSGSVLVLTTAGISAAARLNAACLDLTAEMFAERQLEHLVDGAVLAAGGGPLRPSAISTVDETNVVFAADLDGNGSVVASGSETSALEVRHSGRRARVRVRLGKQTMTVLEADDTEATLVCLDRDGHEADAATSSLVELTLTPRDRASPAATRRLLFALPARMTW
jgi:hypothetical protein